jgi:hypothetical protein
MSIREELADIFESHEPDSISGTQHEGTPADIETCSCGQWSDTDGSSHREHVIDAILAVGYRKIAPDAETCTEWAVHSHAHGSVELWKPCRDQQDAEDWAGSIAYWRDPGAWKIRPQVVSRTVTAGPWTEVQA